VSQALLSLSAAIAVVLGLHAVALADVSLSHLFSDHMVLQRGRELPIWGKADAGETVTVRMAENEASATADGEGRWQVRLPAMAAGGPHELKIAGKNQLTIHDVLIGEVWIGSGQSNMEFGMSRGVLNGKQELAAANYPRIRLFHVKRVKSDTPLADVDAAWESCTPKTVAGFSAVEYFFGRYLHKQLDVPVGLIESAWGGTPAEYWVPHSSFEKDSSLFQTSNHPHAKKVMQTPSVLYNGMIAPLVPYAIQGVIWYQGESNVPMGAYYGKLFSAMIEGWRHEWNQGDFPFLYVQIAPWKYSATGRPDEGAALVREGQLQTLKLKNTGMAVIMDIGNVDNIHPRNKQDVGLRLGLAARAIAYGEKGLVYSGPIFRSQEIKGDRAVLHFDHVGGGLMAKDGPLREFQIAGKDGKFVPAEAEIVGETVVVHSPKVKQPASVRFAWRDVALPNLFNKEGLPASPFRTSASN